MKNITKYLLPIILIAFLISPAYGFAGMGGSNKTINSTIVRSGQVNTTSSDQDIRLLQHLIEIDPVQLSSQNKLFIRETLIFKNTGEKNFSGMLRTWVPDGVEGVKLQRNSMMEGSLEYQIQPVPPVPDRNIVQWQDVIIAGSLPPLYSLEYVVTSEPTGKLTKTQTFTKKLVFPTIINYKYEGRSGLPAVVIKIIKSEGSTIVLLDENRNEIIPDDSTEEGNSIIYRYGSPQFKEFELRISKSAISSSQISSSNMIGYVIIGLLILLVISYPILRKKSETIKRFEEKFHGLLKGDKEVVEDEEEIAEDEAEPEEPEFEDDAELSGKTKEELENKKSEVVLQLQKLKKDYSDGNLLDEEYEELRRPLKDNLNSINRIIEKME